MQLSQTITNELFQIAEKKTFTNLQQEIEFLKSSRCQKLKELDSQQSKIHGLISQLQQTDKLVEIQKQQIKAEFDLHLKTLQQQTVINLNQLKQSLDQQLNEIQFE